MGKDRELLIKSCFAPNYINTERSERFIRKLKSGNEYCDWERFCILPNVEGQKYTLGQSYISRKKQGEFIFLPEHPPNERNVGCEISIKNGKYFVNPLDKSGQVFLNNEKFFNKTEIKVGNCLSLSFGTETEIFKFANRLSLRDATKQKRARKNKSKSTSTKIGTKSRTEFSPRQNELTFSHILSHLSLDDLKNVRFVSRQWNQEALKIINKTCAVTFEFESDYPGPQESMKFFQYSVEMQEIPMSRWNIDLPIFQQRQGYGRALDATPGQPGSKFVDDFNWFISSPNIENMKILELAGQIHTKLEFDLRLKVLQTVQKTLQELCISGTWYQTSDQVNCEFPENLNFPNLKSFSLKLITDTEGEECYNLKWLQNLFRGITKISTLDLLCYDEQLAVSFLDHIHNLANSFSHLEELSISSANPVVIKKILQVQVKTPLRKLQVSDLNITFTDFDTREDWILYDHLLSKYSTTLQELSFDIPHKNEKSEKGQQFIIFPTFPNLKYLRVSWESGKEPLDLMFPGGGINYENDFPSLQSLAVYPEINGDPFRGTVSEAFFPATKEENLGDEPIQVFNGLQYLEIFPDKGFEDESITPDIVTAIAGMFPKVSNYDWITAMENAGVPRA